MANKAYIGGKNKKYGDLSVGNTVSLNVNGVPKDFIVVQQGKPSSLYDDSCNGTWLMMKDIYANRAMDSSDNNYGSSDIHSYLNGTFFGLFDSNVQSFIKQVKIPYHKGVGNSGSISSGANGLSTKVFLLSCYEVGWTKSNSDYFPVDGACLSYFSGAANSKRIAYLNGTASIWWLRSAEKSDKIDFVYVDKTGYYDKYRYYSTYGIRPVIIVDSSAYLGGKEIVATEIKKAYIGDEQNLARKIKRAYIGDNNGIAQLCYGNPTIKSKAVGSSVFMNVNGTRTEFIVVHKGIPSSMYDSSCDGVWLMMKNLLAKRTWASEHNGYYYSSIRSYMSTLLSQFDTNIQALIKEVKIPYGAASSTSTVYSGSSGISSKLFVPSAYEVGINIYVRDGSILDYFNGAANSKRIAYLSGSASQWWTRSNYASNSTYVAVVNTDGGAYSGWSCKGSAAVRPFLILPHEAELDENNNVIG